MQTQCFCLFENVNVFLCANLLKNFRPDRDADFPEVSLPEQKHQGARLPDTTADGERNLVFKNGAMVGQPQEVELLG